jgi:hypothetical protein
MVQNFSALNGKQQGVESETRTQTEGLAEQGAEENIWTEKG